MTGQYNMADGIKGLAFGVNRDLGWRRITLLRYLVFIFFSSSSILWCPRTHAMLKVITLLHLRRRQAGGLTASSSESYDRGFEVNKQLLVQCKH